MFPSPYRDFQGGSVSGNENPKIFINVLSGMRYWKIFMQYTTAVWSWIKRQEKNVSVGDSF